MLTYCVAVSHPSRSQQIIGLVMRNVTTVGVRVVQTRPPGNLHLGTEKHGFLVISSGRTVGNDSELSGMVFEGVSVLSRRFSSSKIFLACFFFAFPGTPTAPFLEVKGIRPGPPLAHSKDLLRIY